MSTSQDNDAQLSLFAEPAQTTAEPPEPAVAPVPPTPEQEATAERLPANLALGTSSWSFPGWAGVVYRDERSPGALARSGLEAYCANPLHTAVGVDRTFYGPISMRRCQQLAKQTPDGFRFMLKAHSWCTLARFRGGPRDKERNPYFLDPDYCQRVVIQPVLNGLADKFAILHFQLSPQSRRDIGTSAELAERMEDFFAALPDLPHLTYAIELRHGRLLTDAYSEMLDALDGKVIHCLSHHPSMPALALQERRVPGGRRCLVRWMLRRNHTYQSATRAMEPFDDIREPDPGTRERVAELVLRQLEERPVTVIVNNKAEGCAPRSLQMLAETVAAAASVSPD